MVSLCAPDVEWTQRGARETCARSGRKSEGAGAMAGELDDYSFEAQRLVDCGGD